MVDSEATSPSPRPPAAAEIQDWIVQRLSTEFQVSPAEIRPDLPLIDLGLDSMQFVALWGDLERWLGCRFKDNPLIDHPTAEALSRFLADQLAHGTVQIEASVGPQDT
jgi:acyl carrier protein